MISLSWKQSLKNLFSRRQSPIPQLSRSRLERLQLQVLEDRVNPSLSFLGDLNPLSNGSSNPGNLTNVNGTLFFTADDGVNGRELWKSDGTIAGTVIVKDIRPGFLSSVPETLANVNGTLFFTADDGVNGRELWKSDGTAAGTVMVRNIGPGSVSGIVGTAFTNVNGTLFFEANDGVNGRELWKSDGTAAGTVIVKDIHPGSNSSMPASLTNFNGTLIFAANDGANGNELWKSDGTAAGTVMVKDIYPGKFSNDTIPFSGILPEGTLFIELNGALLFYGNDAQFGNELWRTDGTTAGTQIVQNIRLNGSSQILSFGAEADPTIIFDTLYFRATVGNPGFTVQRIVSTDGTTAGTRNVASLPFGISLGQSLTDVNGTLFYTRSDAELWRTDGTEGGTVQVSVTNGSSPRSITNVNGTVFFTADDGVNGRELWKSDGTTIGTVLAAEVIPGNKGGSPQNLTAVGTKLFFTADDGMRGRELWVFDTTNQAPTGTNPLPVVPPGFPVVPPGFPPGVPSSGSSSVSREFAVGAGAGSTVQFFNPDGTLRSKSDVFPGFAGGVRTATADFNRDGVADIVVGTGPGGPTQVQILDGQTQSILFRIDPFEASFAGGVYVAVGDLTRDGIPDLVITPDRGGGPRARVLDGKTFNIIADFFGIEDPNFRGGARAAVGDITGDGFGELIIAAGFGGGPRISVWDGSSLENGRLTTKPMGDFFAFEPGLRNGSFLAIGDITGDGVADLVFGGGPGGAPRVRAFDGAKVLQVGGFGSVDEIASQAQLANFFAGDVNSRGGVRLSIKNLDGDQQSDIVVGAGEGDGSLVIGYLGKNLSNPVPEFSLDAIPGFAEGVFVG